jgi:pilus assembly protein CpaF
MVLMSGVDLPSRAIREQIVSALDVIVHVRRFEDGIRRIESVAEVVGLEGDTPLLNDLFTFRRKGRQGRKVQGAFQATGVVPRLAEALSDRGTPLSPALFQPEPEGRRG